MGICYQPRLRLRDAGVRQIPAGTLINRVMDGAQQGIGQIPWVPPEGGAVRLNEGGILPEGGQGTLLGGLQHQPGGGGLAYSRRPVQNQVLGIRGAELCQKGGNGTLLPYDVFQAVRPQKLHDGLGKLDLFQLLQLFPFLLLHRGFVALFFLFQYLAADILHIVLMVFLQPVSDFLLQICFQGPACQKIRHLFNQLVHKPGDILFLRHSRQGRIVVHDFLQRKDTLTLDRGAYQLQCLHLAGLDDQLVGAVVFHHQGKNHVNLAVQLILDDSSVALRRCHILHRSPGSLSPLVISQVKKFGKEIVH